MSLLHEIEAHCPYCDAPLALEAEPGLARQAFIEDCPVCCRAIEIELILSSKGDWQLSVRTEDDTR